MTHEQIVAALRRGYQLDDARESRRYCYPIRRPRRARREADVGGRAASDKPDATGFSEGCAI